jgi:D-alanyl-D-alanine carboxypeptidase
VEDPAIEPAPAEFLPETGVPILSGFHWSECSMSNINCMRCVVDGQEFDCEQALFLESTGAVGVAPRSTVWADGRWNIVRYDRRTGQYGYLQQQWVNDLRRQQPVYDPEEGVARINNQGGYAWRYLSHSSQRRSFGLRGDFFGHASKPWNPGQQENPRPTPTPDPCANQILVDFRLRNESRTNPILPYIQISVAQAFQNALDVINVAVPGGIGFTEVFRTRAIQQGLWDNRHTNPNPVAPPGTSRHEGGFAFDVPGVAYRDNRGRIHQTALGRTIIPIFARHGFAWGGSFNDPPHFEADFRLGGYSTSAEAAAAANTYYENCSRPR